MDEPRTLIEEMEQVAHAAAWEALHTTRAALQRATRRKERVERQYLAACVDWIAAFEGFSRARKLLPGGEAPRWR